MGKRRKNPCLFSPLSLQTAPEATVTVCKLFLAELYLSLAAQGNLNKRNKAGHSVSNCCLHNFFLIVLSVDNLCQNEHSSNDAGRRVCQILTPSEYYYTDLVLGLCFSAKKFHRHYLGSSQISFTSFQYWTWQSLTPKRRSCSLTGPRV